MVDQNRADAELVSRMQSAAHALRAAGFEVDAGQSPAAHLRRALHWYRYSTGPVPDLHRALGRDVARGSLRLWAAAGGVPQVLSSRPVRRGSGRIDTRLARVQLSGQARTLCAALRDDLAAQAAVLPRRAVGAFDQRVHQQVLRVTAELDEVMARRLHELGFAAEPPGWPEPAVAQRLPARRRPGLENRLSTLVGAGFGAGVSVSAARIVADLRPDWGPAAAMGCALLGLGLTSWTVLARRLLAERAAAERWSVEVAAGLRLLLEERVLARILAAECDRS